MPLRRESYERDENGHWHPEGEVLEVLNLSRGTLTVLEQVDADAIEDEEDTDEEPDYPTNDEGEPLCVGKEDGQCGNTVDEPGGTCWHHSDD